MVAAIGCDGFVCLYLKQQNMQPLDDRELFICGEACSDVQGWVEGALQTAEMMLAKFGLSAL